MATLPTPAFASETIASETLAQISNVPNVSTEAVASPKEIAAVPATLSNSSILSLASHTNSKSLEEDDDDKSVEKEEDKSSITSGASSSSSASASAPPSPSKIDTSAPGEMEKDDSDTCSESSPEKTSAPAGPLSKLWSVVSKDPSSIDAIWKKVSQELKEEDDIHDESVLSPIILRVLKANGISVTGAHGAKCRAYVAWKEDIKPKTKKRKAESAPETGASSSSSAAAPPQFKENPAIGIKKSRSAAPLDPKIFNKVSPVFFGG